MIVASQNLRGPWALGIVSCNMCNTALELRVPATAFRRPGGPGPVEVGGAGAEPLSCLTPLPSKNVLYTIYTSRLISRGLDHPRSPFAEALSPQSLTLRPTHRRRHLCPSSASRSRARASQPARRAPPPPRWRRAASPRSGQPAAPTHSKSGRGGSGRVRAGRLWKPPRHASMSSSQLVQRRDGLLQKPASK